MTSWISTYMLGVVVFGYLILLITMHFCMQKCRAMIKHTFPDKRKRNDIENAIFRCLVACWLLTSFFGALVFFLSLICMLLLILVILYLFD